MLLYASLLLKPSSFSHIFKRIFEVSPRTNPHTFNSLILILWNIFLSSLCTGICVYLRQRCFFFSFVRWRLRMKVQKTFNAFSRRSRNICLRNSNFSLAQRPDTFFARVSSYYQDRSRWKQTNVIINCFWQSSKRNKEGKKLWFYTKIAMFITEFWDKMKSKSCKFRKKVFLNIFWKKKRKISINSYRSLLSDGKEKRNLMENKK